MRTILIAFLLAYAIHGLAVIVSNRALFGDASWYLVSMLSNGAVTQFYRDFFHEFYYSRFLAYSLTQWPTTAAIHAGVAEVSVLSFIYGATFYFWKFLSLFLSYWLLPRRDKNFIVFPILAMIAGTINSEFYLVSEIHISTAFYWPLLIAVVWLPVPLTRFKSLGLGAAIAATSFLYESMALLLLIPLAVLLWGLRRQDWERATKIRASLLATLMIVGVLMNWMAILFPRDPINKGGFLGGISLLVHDFAQDLGAAHAGPVASIGFFLIAIAVLLTAGWEQKAIAWLGAISLATLPPIHFLVFRESLVFANSITDRGFSGLVMQFGLATLLIIAYRYRKLWQRIDSPMMALLLGGLVLGQLSWQSLATKSWIEATAAVRNVVTTRAGPQFCESISAEYARSLDVSLNRILCSWWVTPYSILLAPDAQVRSLILSSDAFRPFDPLSAEVLPSMKFTRVKYDEYVKSLADQYSVAPGETVGFTLSGRGWFLTKSGFSYPEAWATWSDGKTAELSLCFKNGGKAKEGTRLRFKVGAFVPAVRPRLIVGIDSGGRQIGEWVFDNGEAIVERFVSVPREIIQNGCVTLNFTMSDIASPASLGLSGDPRRIGFALVEMRVGS